MTTKLRMRHILVSLAGICILNSCEPEPVKVVFEDQLTFTIFDYLEQNEEVYSSFIEIIDKGLLKNTLSCYNPDGDGYTLFLPDNNAIDDFIESDPRYSSLDEILADVEFCKAFSRYHVVNMSVNSNEFPFGAFTEPTLSGDYLTVSFFIVSDSSYYRINNIANVTQSNIEVSNGYVHVIQKALTPVTKSTYQWLLQNPEFSIFTNAINLTGLAHLIDFNLKEIENMEAVTVILEPDSVFHKSYINSIDVLIALVSPDDTNYTNRSNPLNLFVSYHFLKGSFFIDDFVNEYTLYSTHSDIPVAINGTGLDIKVNQGKQILDTIIVNTDTTYIDYSKFIYDESNVISQTGAIHFIDQIMFRVKPAPTIRTFQFFEEPSLNELRQKGGSYLLDDEGQFSRLDWTGMDLFFVALSDQETQAWNNDYLEIKGDFELSYIIPEIVQGNYNVILGADSFNENNALIEVFIDGKKIGGVIDLTRGASASNPFRRIELGQIDIKRYSEHKVEIKPLIPGRLLWDYIRFEPIKQ